MGRAATHKAKLSFFVSRCHYSSSDRFSASKRPRVNSSSLLLACREHKRVTPSPECMCRYKSERTAARGIMIMQQIQIIYWGISSILSISVTHGRSDSEWWRDPTPPFLTPIHRFHSHKVPKAPQCRRNDSFYPGGEGVMFRSTT